MLISSKKVELKNGNTLYLKSPTSEDAQNILNHLKKLFHQSYRNMNHPKNHWDHISLEEEAKVLTDFASSPNKFMISAFAGERIVGNIACYGMAGEFLKLNVRIGMGLEEEYHGLGLGSALLKYTIDICKQKKIHRLELNVRTFNEAGILLYEKVGFRRIGILKEIAFIDGVFYDEYLYEMLLK